MYVNIIFKPYSIFPTDRLARWPWCLLICKSFEYSPRIKKTYVLSSFLKLLQKTRYLPTAFLTAYLKSYQNYVSFKGQILCHTNKWLGNQTLCTCLQINNTNINSLFCCVFNERSTIFSLFALKLLKIEKEIKVAGWICLRSIQ